MFYNFEMLKCLIDRMFQVSTRSNPNILSRTVELLVASFQHTVVLKWIR